MREVGIVGKVRYPSYSGKGECRTRFPVDAGSLGLKTGTGGYANLSAAQSGTGDRWKRSSCQTEKSGYPELGEWVLKNGGVAEVADRAHKGRMGRKSPK